VSVSGRWHFAFWERDLIRRFILFCALLAFLVLFGVAGRSVQRSANPPLRGACTMFVDWETVANHAVSA
jgi:hypothetical protein